MLNNKRTSHLYQPPKTSFLQNTDHWLLLKEKLHLLFNFCTTSFYPFLSILLGQNCFWKCFILEVVTWETFWTQTGLRFQYGYYFFGLQDKNRYRWPKLHKNMLLRTLNKNIYFQVLFINIAWETRWCL